MSEKQKAPIRQIEDRLVSIGKANCGEIKSEERGKKRISSGFFKICVFFFLVCLVFCELCFGDFCNFCDFCDFCDFYIILLTFEDEGRKGLQTRQKPKGFDIMESLRRLGSQHSVLCCHSTNRKLKERWAVERREVEQIGRRRRS